MTYKLIIQMFMQINLNLDFYTLNFQQIDGEDATYSIFGDDGIDLDEDVTYSIFGNDDVDLDEFFSWFDKNPNQASVYICVCVFNFIY